MFPFLAEAKRGKPNESGHSAPNEVRAQMKPCTSRNEVTQVYSRRTARLTSPQTTNTQGESRGQACLPMTEPQLFGHDAKRQANPSTSSI